MTKRVSSPKSSQLVQYHSRRAFRASGDSVVESASGGYRVTRLMPRAHQARVAVLAISVLSASVLSSCSSWFSSDLSAEKLPPNSAVEIAADGAIVVAGPVPPIRPLDDLVTSARALGFAPVAAMHDGWWLSIDRSKARVTLMEGSRKVLEESAQLGQTIEPGTYSLKHKQRQAAWHAPETYFTRRGLPVPGEGERGRFLRGAYGEFALFWDKNSALHSGPMTLEETEAIQVREDILSQFYYSLPIGAPIEVR